MKKFQNGLVESIMGVVVGIVLTAMIAEFTKTGVLPGYSTWVFGLFSIIASIALINSLQYAGALYTIGWLLGALLLKDSMSTVDKIFNMGGPILVIILRIYFGIRSIQS